MGGGGIGVDLLESSALMLRTPPSSQQQPQQHHHQQQQHHQQQRQQRNSVEGVCEDVMPLDYDSLVENAEGFEMTNLDSTSESIGV